MDRDQQLAEAGAFIEHGLVRRFGFRVGESLAAPAVVHDEIRAVRAGAGVFDATPRCRVRVLGPDAAAFLDRLLTVAVKLMPSGGGQRAFLLDAKGRIRLAFHLMRIDAMTFFTDATPGHGDDIIKVLDMFHFGEQLHFETGVGAYEAMSVHGPAAAEVVRAIGLPVPEAPYQQTTAAVGGVQVRAVRIDRIGSPGFDLLLPPHGYGEIWSAAVRAGAVPAGLDALEALRVAAGVADHPNEYGEHTSPLELDAMHGISEGKGCYPGQEVIERTLALGRPPRRLVRLALDRWVDAGTALMVDGKSVGELTSVAHLPDEGVLALGLVKRRGADGPWTAADATARERVQNE